MEQYKTKNGKKEQIKHNHLKAIAKDFLHDLGFTDKEIFEEYVVSEQSMREKIRVDVVGITREKKIAIECGSLSAQKLSWLNLFFDEVIHLPYMNERITQGACLDAYKRRIKDLTEQLENEKKKVSENEKRSEQARDELRIERELLGKTVVLGLYKIGCLPTEILHASYKDAITHFEHQLNERTNPPFVEKEEYDRNSKVAIVGLRNARI